MATLRYGTDSELQLDFRDDALVSSCGMPKGTPLVDLAGAIRDALMHPLELPPLAQSVVPGDKVAIALGQGVPQAPQFVAVIVEELIEGGVKPDDITVVWTRDDFETGAVDPRSEISPEIRPEVHLVMHDASHRDQLCYIAATEDGKPVYVNRAIGEADMLVPVGCARLASSLGYAGPASGIFATFSDEPTSARFRAPEMIDSAGRRKKLRALAEEANWLLGVLFAIQVVPGSGNDVLHVVAGKADDVFSRGQELCEEAWNFEVPHRASVVVAGLEGGAQQQTWANLARALAAASKAVAEDGVIVICTEVAADVGPGVQRLCNAEDLDEVLHDLKKERPIDTLIAVQLARALQRGPVYLLSQMDETVVEDLGIANVASAKELTRLVGQHDSCILLANAHHAMPIPSDD